MLRRQQSWPRRYSVVVHFLNGRSADYTVSTWLGREKAVILAVQAADREHAWAGVYDAEVEELGRVAESRGVATPEKNDVLDRNEW